MREVAAAGHEVGVHAFDHVRWQDFVADRSEGWTRKEFDAALGAFERVFGAPARTCGAAGWQLNEYVPAMEGAAGMLYASDCRGSCPFQPSVPGACPQLPTTLPTLDELIGAPGLDEHNVHSHLLQTTESAPETGHVYTLHAELEGMKLMPVFERLLDGWKAQGYALGTTGELFAQINVPALPQHEIIRGRVEGRSGLLAVQGPAVCPAF
ncbi:MAG TPA: hypothetical protein ENK16_05165 [Chromatiales bacterium]|nr:hypothetical protein [Chromatiales bacterium]